MPRRDDFYDYKAGSKRSEEPPSLVGFIIVPLVILAVVFGIVAFFVAGVADAWNIKLRSLLNGFWYAWFLPPGGLPHDTPLFWWLVSAIVLSAAVIWLPGWKKGFRRTIVIVLIAMALVFMSVRGIFLWAETAARYYNSNTEYVVEDLDSLPDTLTRVAQSESAQIDIVEGTMPSEWEPCVASATGASYVMQKTGDSNAACDAPSTLTDAELATCLNLLTEELLARQNS